MAGGLGFEPRLTESESAVLPLDDPPPIRRVALNIYDVPRDIYDLPREAAKHRHVLTSGFYKVDRGLGKPQPASRRTGGSSPPKRKPENPGQDARSGFGAFCRNGDCAKMTSGECRAGGRHR